MKTYRSLLMFLSVILCVFFVTTFAKNLIFKISKKVVVTAFSLIFLYQLSLLTKLYADAATSGMFLAFIATSKGIKAYLDVSDFRNFLNLWGSSQYPNSKASSYTNNFLNCPEKISGQRKIDPWNNRYAGSYRNSFWHELHKHYQISFQFTRTRSGLFLVKYTHGRLEAIFVLNIFVAWVIFFEITQVTLVICEDEAIFWIHASFMTNYARWFMQVNENWVCACTDKREFVANVFWCPDMSLRYMFCWTCYWGTRFILFCSNRNSWSNG